MHVGLKVSKIPAILNAKFVGTVFSSWKISPKDTMIDFLKWFKTLVNVQKINADNNVFKLHYKLTVMMLVVFAILLTSSQYFGEPILCQGGPSIPENIINTYCWITGTYAVRGATGESGFLDKKWVLRAPLFRC